MSKVEEIIKKFIEENKISCPECIYQCDWVIEHAYELIENLCDEVGYYEESEEE